jgi:hypothetical protein
MHDDHRRARLRCLGMDGKKLMARLLREVNRIANDQPGHDFVRPAFFARVVGLRENRDRG